MIAPDQWRPVAVELLEPGAKQAVTMTKGSAVVVANPGSGKTELLAQRADFLLRTGICRYPKKILAISFKNDAARTLRRRVADRSGFDHAHRIDSMTFHGFARRIIQIFRPLLRGKDQLDPGFKVGTNRVGRVQVAFDELLPLAQRLIDQYPMVKRSVNMAYSHVFLDEFQDCTTEQLLLIRTLFKDAQVNFTAVGDAKQMIMGFAGALEGVMEDFAQEFNATRLGLIQNWRSDSAIRRVLNRMVAVMEPQSSVPEHEIQGKDGSVYWEHFASEQDEAKAIARQIAAWIEQGIAPHEIAILHRAQPHFFNQAIEVELDRLEIPYRSEQELQDLSSEPLAQLIVNVLRVISEKSAPDAYTAALYALTESAEDDQRDWVGMLHQSRSMLMKCQENRASLALQLVQKIIESLGQSGVMALSSDSDAQRIKELQEEIFSKLRSLVGRYGELEQALARFCEKGAVRVMTMHKCKGMEFGCVVMPGTEAQTWWGGELGNRRSFFVGVSRAKHSLVVTCAASRACPDGANKSKWSTARETHQEFAGYFNPGSMALSA
ncbi:ATP-dependent helicase [Xanthomonas campestris pv. campestris]|uniref:ATP-dependent helicase n=1 Tax=Xanthomonas campestris TaxID=339 RepID=UPI0023786845|nr:ATP-dependent helicase [Xanthomonas campestris]WDL65333.1 ATP-dependent helicase [Xanthomonas campestris pv. campestris]